jgi:hypothetical protein
MARVTDQVCAFEDGQDGEISIQTSGRTVVMPALLPDLYPLDASKLPQPPYRELIWADRVTRAAEAASPLPVLLGTPAFHQHGSTLRLGADLFGAAFLLLSGYQEACTGPRDAHGRFPGSQSLQARGGFVHRPIVDEFAALLRHALRCLGLEAIALREPDKTVLRISCDVDHPFDPTARSITSCLLAVGADIVRRRSATLAARRAANMVLSRLEHHRLDPLYTFGWYMDQCERHGHQATFFFLAARTPGVPDGSYDLEDPRIPPLLRLIHARGHLIGLHGSYMSYRSSAAILAERERLMRTLDGLGIQVEIRSNRQHYLRWDPLMTPDLLDAAGFAEDLTGGFADTCGFRFGTAFPFRMWSWQRRRPLRLAQRPLLLMEQTVLRGATDHRNVGRLLASASVISGAMNRTGGELHILWHNSMLLSAAQRRGFTKVIGR